MMRRMLAQGGAKNLFLLTAEALPTVFGDDLRDCAPLCLEHLLDHRLVHVPNRAGGRLCGYERVGAWKRPGVSQEKQ